MYYIYILKIEGKKRYYIGVTGNIERRLKQHVYKNVISTKGRNPKLIYFEEISDKHNAWKKEKWFKSGIGRTWIKDNLLSMGG